MDVHPSQLTTDQGTLVSTISQVVMATNEIWQSGRPETLNELAGYVLARGAGWLAGWLLAGCLTHTHYSLFCRGGTMESLVSQPIPTGGTSSPPDNLHMLI